VEEEIIRRPAHHREIAEKQLGAQILKSSQLK